MAYISVKGIESLNNKLDAMGKVTDRVKKQLVNEGANVILDQMKNDAPKGDDNSYKKLGIVDGRSGDGYLFLDVGINHKNWDECRGLYFQNYDGERSSGEHVQWIDKSFSRSHGKAKKIIRDGLKRAVMK